MKLDSGKSLRTTHEKLKDVWGKKKSLLLKLHDTEYHIRSIHILHKCLPDRLELRPALSPALTHPRRPRGRCEGKSKQAQKYGRAPGDNVLPDQFQTVAAVLTSDWCQKTFVFFHPIAYQKEKRRRPFGTGLVRHCTQGLFSPFFTFLRAKFSRPFRLSLAPTICPWVLEDGSDYQLEFFTYLGRISFKNTRTLSLE